MNDREHLLEALNRGRDELLAAVSGIPADGERVAPAAGGWSPLECVEHVAIVEARSLGRIQTQSVPVDVEMSRKREPVLYDRLSARAEKVQAPAVIHPAGRYASVDEALRAFLAAREQTIAWLNACDLDLRRRSVQHPALGMVSGYEFMLMMAGHPARHANQIREAVKVN